MSTIKQCELNYYEHLTTFLCGSNHAECTRKANLWKTKVNTTRQNLHSFNLGKNGSCAPGGLGGRSVVVFRQGGRQTQFLQFTKFLKSNNFNSTTFPGCLKGFMVLMASIMAGI